MKLSKCICSVMGRPGTKCRKCSRIVPELKIVVEEYVAPIKIECYKEDCTCDEDCNCEEDCDCNK